MTESLTAQLQCAYPTGRLYELDEKTLESNTRDDRMIDILRQVLGKCPLSVTLSPFTKPAYKITFTHKNHPPFDEWVWLMSNPQKLAWIENNNGEPYPAFWLNFSRVADFYFFFYNHWVPRGNTGYLDADCKRKPDAQWANFETIIRSELENGGFQYLTAEANEKTPLVCKQDFASIPDGDPRWDLPDFEPPFVPCSLHECLFGD